MAYRAPLGTAADPGIGSPSDNAILFAFVIRVEYSIFICAGPNGRQQMPAVMIRGISFCRGDAASGGDASSSDCHKLLKRPRLHARGKKEPGGSMKIDSGAKRAWVVYIKLARLHAVPCRDLSKRWSPRYDLGRSRGALAYRSRWPRTKLA